MVGGECVCVWDMCVRTFLMVGVSVCVCVGYVCTYLPHGGVCVCVVCVYVPSSWWGGECVCVWDMCVRTFLMVGGECVCVCGVCVRTFLMVGGECVCVWDMYVRTFLMVGGECVCVCVDVPSSWWGVSVYFQS